MQTKGPKRSTREALKRAIMLEVHGLRFYQVASERCRDEKARELFQDLARDELRHKEELEAHFRGILRGNLPPVPRDLPTRGNLKFNDPVLSRDLKERIEEAWFESAALAIGVMLERKAIDYYRKKEEASQDPGTKELFSWLIQWERGHLKRLMALERTLREEIWHEARFWPLD